MMMCVWLRFISRFKCVFRLYNETVRIIKECIANLLVIIKAGCKYYDELDEGCDGRLI